MDKFSETPFQTRPPRLKDLIDQHLMGSVWVRDTPFGPVTDSLVLAKQFGIEHQHVLRAVDKCRHELLIEPKFGLNKNPIDNKYLGGSKGRQRMVRKVDVTEFGLALLLLYISTPKARRISAEILYRFFVLKTYLAGLTHDQVGTLRGYYRQKMNAD